MKKNWVTLSRGIIAHKNLSLFLNEGVSVKFFRFKTRVNSVIGWGHKPTAQKARNYAKKHNLPYIALEDGFLRSVGLGVEGAAPLSLVVDEVGIYYDARQPSKLEELITASSNLESEMLARSRACISAIREFRLSKYNQYNSDPILLAEKPKVVVIDQTKGDASVVGAKADEHTFVDMLATALQNHPNETIWVKTHPDVVCGKKQGFLYPLPFENSRIKVYSESINPWDFLVNAENVYTVSSLMGFEALMAGSKVHCFGVPFYAGWGLTEDKLSCERRVGTRSLEQVFAAAYIQYARYVDPIHAKRCEIETIINYLIDQLVKSKRVEEASLHNISWWKQRWITDFTSSWVEKINHSSTRKLVWGMPESVADGDVVSRIEDGFIRSVGLGVHFNRPISLVCDHSGLYFDARKASDLETMLNTGHFSDWDRLRAKNVIDSLNQLRLTKYNVGIDFIGYLPSDKTIILVPGQVEQDASIRYGSPEIRLNSELLKRVRERNADAFIIYKPHPDIISGQRDNGCWEGEHLRFADLIVQDCSMSSLLEQVDEVHTITSLTGFEALLRGKKVTTYGLPFYAGWGLTQDYVGCSRRTAKRTLEELVVAALIRYPTYVDPISKKTCTIEQAIERLNSLKEGNVQIKDRKLQVLLLLKSSKRLIKRILRI